MGNGLLAVGLGSLLIDGDELIWILLRLVEVGIAGVPDEVLEELVTV